MKKWLIEGFGQMPIDCLERAIHEMLAHRDKVLFDGSISDDNGYFCPMFAGLPEKYKTLIREKARHHTYISYNLSGSYREITGINFHTDPCKSAYNETERFVYELSKSSVEECVDIMQMIISDKQSDSNHQALPCS